MGGFGDTCILLVSAQLVPHHDGDVFVPCEPHTLEHVLIMERLMGRVHSSEPINPPTRLVSVRLMFCRGLISGSLLVV